ncbi:hypothetical protein R6Q59_034596 [Mikania micrantha]
MQRQAVPSFVWALYSVSAYERVRAFPPQVVEWVVVVDWWVPTWSDNMAIKRSEAWSWMNDVMPFVAMLMITCSDMSALTIVKAAMNDGMASIVYVVYHDVLGMLILLPFYIIGICRNDRRPPLSFHLLFRFFILGLLGLCLNQVLAYEGVYYSSPTMASALQTWLLPTRS